MKQKTVDAYIAKQDQWQEALQQLRELLLHTELEETLKWGMPVYCLDGKNVVGIGAFKAYVGLWFYQGVFLSDPHGLLVNAQEGRTKAMRQLRFSSIEEMDEQVIQTYVLEAIQNQKEGKEVRPDTHKALQIPEELASAFQQDRGLKEAFDAFTPGKQREFAGYVGEAKRADTRMKRLEKVIPMIREGVGLNDRYK